MYSIRDLPENFGTTYMDNLITAKIVNLLE